MNTIDKIAEVIFEYAQRSVKCYTQDLSNMGLIPISSEKLKKLEYIFQRDYNTLCDKDKYDLLKEVQKILELMQNDQIIDSGPFSPRNI